MSRSPNPTSGSTPAETPKPKSTPTRQGSLYESREDRRLGFLLCFIGLVLLILPWLVPGAVTGLSVGLVIGKIVGVAFLAGGIVRVWTAQKAMVALREDPQTG